MNSVADGTRTDAVTHASTDRLSPEDAAGDVSIDGNPARLTTRLRAILAVVLIADVLDLMDATITNIAAPSIVREIGGGEALIKWLGASYALAMGVLLVVGGRLGDRYGKRRLFLINIVLGASGLIAAIRLLPHDEPISAVPIDGLGAGLLGATMVGLLYGLIDGSTAGWTALPILSLVGGAVLFVGFGVRQRLAADPLILPSLLTNRGFTAGLLLGVAFFAAVNGLAYVVSLFFQTALGLTPSAAALGLAPMMVGIIGASFVCRPLIPKLGRLLVVIGLGVTLAAAVGVWATVLAYGTAVSVWALAPSLFVLGMGMGACFSSIYDVAIGDVAPAEAGSASGALSAVQQLAAGIGSAVVTTVYFSQRAGHGAGHAMTVSVAVVGGITLLCLALVWLLPPSAPQEPAAAP